MLLKKLQLWIVCLTFTSRIKVEELKWMMQLCCQLVKSITHGYVQECWLGFSSKIVVQVHGGKIRYCTSILCKVKKMAKR